MSEWQKNMFYFKWYSTFKYNSFLYKMQHQSMIVMNIANVWMFVNSPICSLYKNIFKFSTKIFRCLFPFCWNIILYHPYLFQSISYCYKTNNIYFYLFEKLTIYLWSYVELNVGRQTGKPAIFTQEHKCIDIIIIITITQSIKFQIAYNDCFASSNIFNCMFTVIKENILICRLTEISYLKKKTIFGR